MESKKKKQASLFSFFSKSKKTTSSTSSKTNSATNKKKKKKGNDNSNKTPSNNNEKKKRKTCESDSIQSKNNIIFVEAEKKTTTRKIPKQQNKQNKKKKLSDVGINETTAKVSFNMYKNNNSNNNNNELVSSPSASSTTTMLNNKDNITVDGEKKDETKKKNDSAFEAAPQKKEVDKVEENNIQYDAVTGLSLYEQRRLENIERNKRILESLGLGKAKAAISNTLKKKKVKLKSTKKKLKQTNQKLVSTRPVRRSRRQQQQNISYNENDLEKNVESSNSNNNSYGSSSSRVIEEPKEEELPFDISNIFAYSCYDDDQNGNDNNNNKNKVRVEKVALPSTSTFNNTTTLKRLKNVGNNDKYFSDPKLKKIYSISFQQVEQPDVFIAGGHGGMVSAFGIHDIVRTYEEDEDEYDFIEPLMSFKAHSGWISTVQLINSINSNKKHVLMTASNDAVLTLWDMTKQLNTERKKDIRPKILATNNNLHNNGIFCAHERNGKIVTGSKDKSVVVSKIHEEGKGILPLHEYCFHTGVVKSTSFRDDNIIASGGNDSTIFIYDIRVEKGLTTQSDDDAHHYAINSISWHPTEEHSLISADFGNTINVWDLRKFQNPVKQLKGHSHIYDNQRGSIYHPCFVANGKNILTNGAKTDTLSIFNFETGVLESKGSVDIGNVECVGTNNIWGSLIACSRGNKIQLMQGEFNTV